MQVLKCTMKALAATVGFTVALPLLYYWVIAGKAFEVTSWDRENTDG